MRQRRQMANTLASAQSPRHPLSVWYPDGYLASHHHHQQQQQQQKQKQQQQQQQQHTQRVVGPPPALERPVVEPTVHGPRTAMSAPVPTFAVAATESSTTATTTTTTAMKSGRGYIRQPLSGVSVFGTPRASHRSVLPRHDQRQRHRVCAPAGGRAFGLWGTPTPMAVTHHT